MSAKADWGDTDFEQEVDHQTEPDENGIKLVVEYRVNEEGKRIRITKKVRVSRSVKKVSKRVEERRQRWKKFGRPAQPGASEVGVTYFGEEVFLVLGEEERKEKERLERERRDKQELESMYNSMIAEGKKPGGPIAAASAVPLPAPGTPAPVAAWKPSWKTGGNIAPPTSILSKENDVNSNSYVPPHKRNDRGGSSSGGHDSSTDNTTTIRVTNLSEETTEMDLNDMFRPFGSIQRTYLVKDKITNVSREFAFITYMSRREAQNAIDAMDGKGWNHLILSVEWAKPSVK